MSTDNVQEASGAKPIQYKGEDIDHIDVRGTGQHPLEISIYMRNGTLINVLPKMSLHETGIRPIMEARHGKWATVPPKE